MMSFKKILSVIATTALLFNSIAPYSVALAQQLTPTPTPVDTSSPTPTDSATPTNQPTITPTDSSSPVASPADQATATPDSTTLTASPTAQPTDTPTPTDTPVVTQAPESNPTAQGPPDSSQPSTSPTAQPTATPQIPIEHGNVTTTVVDNIDLSTINLLNSNVDVPTVTTDKPDYSPTSVVLITGTGFTADKTYTLEISSTDQPPVDFTTNVKVDSNGSFTYAYQLDGTMRPNYTVYVKDGERIVASTTFTDPLPPSAGIDNYTQCSNDDGDGYASGNTGCRWISGNLQKNNSTYFEGDATPQRLFITHLVNGSHTVRIQYGTTKGGKHAYDFLTDDIFSELAPNVITNADFCEDLTGFAGCSGLTPNLSGLIPTDTNAGGFDFAQSARHFKIRNGTITSVGTPVLSGLYTGDSETTILVTFNVDTTNCVNKDVVQGTDTCPVLITWGAHVSSQAGWGAGNSAVSINGSPYHVAIDQLDNGSIGQRDNQMQAEAVVVPGPTIMVNKVLGPSDDPGLFNLTVDSTPYATNVGDGGTTGAVSVSAGSHTVGETAGTNTDLANYTRVIGGDCDSQGNVSIPAGGGKTCTITNTRNTGTIIVDKQVDTNGDGTYEVTTDAGANALGFQWGLDLESPVRNFGNSLAVTTNVIHSISETGPAGYHFVGSLISTEPSSCNDINPNPNNYPVPFLIPNPGGNTRHILLCNARDTGTIELKKVWSGTGGQTTLNIGTTVGGSQVDTQLTGASGADPLTTGQNTVNTGTYNVSETGGLADYSSSLTCTDNEQSVTPGEGNSVTVASGHAIICTFTNTRKTGQVSFLKIVSGGTAVPGDWTFTISGGNGTAKSGDTKTYDTGSYTVTESGPAGYTPTAVEGICTGLDGSNATLTVTEQGGTCSFTNTRDKGKISGIKFDDINGDGEFDPNTEDILAGWTIKLFENSNGVPGGLVASTTTTNPDGYLFDNVPTGSYFVCEVLQGGWMQTLPVTNGGCYLVNLTRNGRGFNDEDFGNFIFASISGHKFNDLNGNGDWDQGEPPLSNWTFQLQKLGGFWTTVDTSVTDGGGNWAFNNLGPGKYRVHEVLKSGWHPTTYTSGYYPSSSGINVFSGANFNNKDFGNHQNKLIIYKYDQDKELLGGATFRICPEEGDCFEVTDNGAGDANNQAGIIEVLGLADDFYTVTESQAPQGYLPDERSCERDINIKSTQVSCSFFDQLQNPALTITKSNNAGSGISAGSTITYTLNVENTGNINFDNVVVTDILPGGFTYVDGSTSGATFVNQIGPKLTWTLSNLGAGNTATITYQVQTNGGLSDGDYKNFATCTATYNSNSEFPSTTPCNQTDSTVTIGHSVSYGGNLGQVLGISTELPATGNPTGLLALALGTLTIGLYMRGFNGKKGKTLLRQGYGRARKYAKN